MTIKPYRPNVGIMVLNADGKVWVGSRTNTFDTEYERETLLWQMPQGGIDEGEDAEIAARRELYEETGIESIELLDQTSDWILYDFPDWVKEKRSEKWSGQKQKWFVYRFSGDDTEIRIDPPPDGHKAEFSAWRWEEMHRLPELIVEFKRDVYQQVVERFGKWAG